MATIKIKNLLSNEQIKKIKEIAEKNARREGHKTMMQFTKHSVKRNKKKYNRKNKNNEKLQ